MVKTNIGLFVVLLVRLCLVNLPLSLQTEPASLAFTDYSLRHAEKT